MAGIRQEKMAELIRRDLSVIFQRQASVWFGGMFISVTQVLMAPDLGLAKVYLSFMVVPDKKRLAAVRQEGWRVPRTGAKIGSKSSVPELNSYLDDSLDYYEAIDQAPKVRHDSRFGSRRYAWTRRNRSRRTDFGNFHVRHRRHAT